MIIASTTDRGISVGDHDQQPWNESDQVEIDDLELVEDDSEDVSGGAPSVQEIHVTKPTDVSSNKLYGP
jgi:hypothetical protein